MRQIYNNYFPTPKFLAMSSFALDISDQSVKYGKLHLSNNGLVLSNYGKENLPAGAIVSGKIENDSKIVEILKILKKRENMHFVRVALPEEQIYLFNLNLPIMKMDEIRDAISLQIEDNIPLSLNATIFDFEIINQNDKEFNIRVLATPIDLIESYLSIFDQAGLVPLSFELEAQAIARSVLHFNAKENVMIVDFGETRTGISIVEDGRVLFTSTFDLGGGILTNMIAKNFNVSFEEADQMKIKYNLSNENENEIFPIILNGISVLRDELNKYYIYWAEHKKEKGFKDFEIHRLILCGGDANLTGIAEYLEASMKLTVSHADVWANVLDSKEIIPEISFGQSLSYATVIGLALGDFIYE